MQCTFKIGRETKSLCQKKIISLLSPVKEKSISFCAKHLAFRCLEKKLDNFKHSGGLMKTHHCSAGFQSKFTVLPGEVDRYQGIWVDLTKIGEQLISKNTFPSTLEASLKLWQIQGITSAWLKVSIFQSALIADAAEHGFTFHHAEGSIATLSLWMDKSKKTKIPRFATHQMGVSGMVINNDTHEILVVKDKNRPYQLWKFPGGLSDLGEDIATTAEREVFEETGVKTEFQSVLAFRQQHNSPGAFGRSDLYVICRLKPLTFDLHPCDEEIAACRWMPVDQLKTEVQATSLTHTMAELAIQGLEHGFSQVDIISYQMASIYKGMKFHIFLRACK
ncbi:unnamed protein product [Lymnaea stagnalis]|uniref:Nucleoside diphosphate-linked moiety X motif 6 n=1 Tax=Lymnaea stagnalis TaxID=6523 RepID=A0AAV2IL80_LYMST